MGTTADSTNSAVVDKSLRYKKITRDTPRNQSMILIRRDAGVAKVGKLKGDDTFYTHYFPLPTFDDAEDQEAA